MCEKAIAQNHRWEHKHRAFLLMHIAPERAEAIARAIITAATWAEI
jgi:hypothetical protein